MSSIDNALLIDRYALRAQPHAVLAASVLDGAAEIARLKRICLALTITVIGTVAALRANNLYGPADVLEKALEAAEAIK